MGMFRDLTQTNFFRHASILQMGSFVQFGISFAGSILIARLLGPDQYGVWALAIVLVGMFGLLLDWGQGAGSLVLFAKAFARNDLEEMRRIGGFYIKITLLLFAFIGLPLFAMAGFIGEAAYGRGDLGWYVRILLAAGLVTTGSALLGIILQVVRSVVSLAAIEIVDQIAKTGLMLAALFAGFGILGIATGQFAGALVAFGIGLAVYRRKIQPLGIVPRIRSMLQAARSIALGGYVRFSLPIAVDKNFSELYHVGTMLMLGAFADPMNVGFFKIALSYMSLAIFPLGAVSRLLQDQLPKDQVKDPETLRKHFIKASLLGGIFALGAGTCLFFAGPWLVRIVYGAGYAGVVPYIKAFWWYTAVVGFGVGLGSFYRTIDKVRIPITLNALLLTIGWPLTHALLGAYGALGAVYSFTMLKGAATLIAFFIGLWILRSGRLPIASHEPL